MLQQTPVARVLPVHERGSSAGRPRPTWPPSRTGEAVRAWGRLGYPRRALRLHAAAVGDRRAARRRGAGVVRRPARAARASATTPPPRSRPSPTAGGTSCSTPTCAGCSRGPWPAWSSRPRRSPGPSATLAEIVLPDDEPTAATWSVAVMELGALVCTAAQPALRRPARSPTCAPGGRPATRRTTGRRGRCRPGPAPTGSAAAGCWRVLRDSDGPVHRSRLDAAWPTPPAGALPGRACSTTGWSSGRRAEPTRCPERPAIATTASTMSLTTRRWSGSIGASGRSSWKPHERRVQQVRGAAGAAAVGPRRSEVVGQRVRPRARWPRARPSRRARARTGRGPRPRRTSASSGPAAARCIASQRSSTACRTLLDRGKSRGSPPPNGRWRSRSTVAIRSSLLSKW